jgi:hypothetical protein
MIGGWYRQAVLSVCEQVFELGTDQGKINYGENNA